MQPASRLEALHRLLSRVRGCLSNTAWHACDHVRCEVQCTPSDKNSVTPY